MKIEDLLAWGSWAIIACVLFTGCHSTEPERSRSGSPADHLPAYIAPLLDAGLRPDWSGDGRHLLYLDKLVGDVFEFEIDSRTVRPLTSHFAHKGFSRARYLANGDLLLCGPRGDAAGESESGRWHTELFYLASDLSTPAVPLDERCFEGPAVSRQNMRIAWTLSDYPDSVVFGKSEIWIGEIVDEGKGPKLVNRRKIVDRSDFYYLAFLESQDFNPPDERELIFTAYAYKGGEVMGVDIETGELRNYSQNWAYDEAEGIFPDGRFVAVERELGTYTAVPTGRIDIWRTALDGSGDTEQLTHFTDFKGYGANNPVVSPDGRYVAFQLRKQGGEHGNGHGIFLLDLAAWESARDRGSDAAPVR